MEGEEIPTTYTDILLENQSKKTILMDNSDFKLALVNADQTGTYSLEKKLRCRWILRTSMEKYQKTVLKCLQFIRILTILRNPLGKRVVMT